MVLKHSLHQLVDELPEEELSTALRFLQYLKEVGGETYETYLDGTDDDGFADTVLSDPEDLPALVTEEEEQLSVADAWRKYLTSKSDPLSSLPD
jgi:hypothetical protein